MKIEVYIHLPATAVSNRDEGIQNEPAKTNINSCLGSLNFLGLVELDTKIRQIWSVLARIS